MTSLRRLRTQRALAVAGLLAVAAPMLSSCGSNAATENPNVIADGGYYMNGDVHVLGARIVTPSQGTGTFVATITVDPHAKQTQLTGLSADGLTFGSMTPVEIPSNGMVNLFTQGGIPVTGDFAAGDDLPVTLTFDNGDSIKVDTRVVTQCGPYADVQVQSSGSGKGKGQQQPQSQPTGEPYTCDYPSVPPLEGQS
jgi:hypothetical protein